MNIVFDIGNVLLHWDPRALYRTIFATEDEVEWFLGNVCNSAWNLEQDRGRSFEDAIAEAVSRHPDHADAIAAYHHRWEETLTHVIDGTVDILHELKAQETPLYAITNWNQDKFRQTKARYDFLHHFRDIVVSGDERMIKPDPAIYRLLLDRNGLEASTCLFIDDSLKNVAGAEAVGMKAHHFTSPETLRAHLVAEGVLPQV
jgi:2-haloacid dehalogenase